MVEIALGLDVGIAEGAVGINDDGITVGIVVGTVAGFTLDVGVL